MNIDQLRLTRGTVAPHHRDVAPDGKVIADEIILYLNRMFAVHLHTFLDKISCNGHEFPHTVYNSSCIEYLQVKRFCTKVQQMPQIYGNVTFPAHPQ